MTGWETTVPSDSLYARLRTWQATHLDDDQYLAWYAPNGRPSKPPLVITLTLLQFRTGVSDREAAANAQYDDR